MVGAASFRFLGGQGMRASPTKGLILVTLVLMVSLPVAGVFGAGGTSTSLRTGEPPVMINLATFEQSNGWSLLQNNFKTVSEISIFHIVPNSDQTFRYDGTYVNVPQVIQAAHKAGVRVALAIGGAGCTPTAKEPCTSETWAVLLKAYRFAIATNSNRTKLDSAVAYEVKSQGYDAVQWDFEDNQSNDFSAANYTALIQTARGMLPNTEFDCVFAPWMLSVNVTMLKPYCDHFLFAFPTSAQYSSSYLKQEASLVGPGKLWVGYDLASTDKYTFHPPKASDLKLDRTAGYGIFFWDGSGMTQSLYNQIASDFGTT
jgi:hypothetical protein